MRKAKAVKPNTRVPKARISVPKVASGRLTAPGRGSSKVFTPRAPSKGLSGYVGQTKFGASTLAQMADLQG